MWKFVGSLLGRLKNESPAGRWTCKICTRTSESYRREGTGQEPIGMCPPCGDTPWGRAMLAGAQIEIPRPQPRKGMRLTAN